MSRELRKQTTKVRRATRQVAVLHMKLCEASGKIREPQIPPIMDNLSIALASASEAVQAWQDMADDEGKQKASKR